jgi:hypothetical protein
MKSAALVLIFAVTSMVAHSCKTPGGPAPVDVSVVQDGGAPVAPRQVNCLTGVNEQAIADAQIRAITLIEKGVNIGSAESVIFKGLEGLAFDLIPGALECALSYLGIKLSYDSSHASGQVKDDKALEAKIARDYLRAHKVVFEPSSTPAAKFPGLN